jgi:hypothetical protein
MEDLKNLTILYVGNVAGPLNLVLEVSIIDVAEHISGAFVSVRKET